jgi:hypothetical protein
MEEMRLASREDRIPRMAERLSVAGLKGQLAALKVDLQHFATLKSSALLTDSIKDRIRQIEMQLAAMRTQGSRATSQVADDPADGEEHVTVYATAARFSPRPRRIS